MPVRKTLLMICIVSLMVVARPVGIGTRVVKWAKRRPLPALLLVLVLALVAGAIGTGIWLKHQEQARRAEQTQRAEQARKAIDASLERAYEAARLDRWQE